MQSPFDYAELDSLVYAYLLERGFDHAAFVFQSQSDAASRSPGDRPRRLVEVVSKGLLVDRIEDEILWDTLGEEDGAAEDAQFSLKDFVDARIDLKLRHVDKNDPVVAPPEPKPPAHVKTPTLDYRTQIHGDLVHVFPLNQATVHIIRISDLSSRKIDLPLPHNEPATGMRWVASSVIVGYSRNTLHFFDPANNGKLLKSLALSPQTEIKRVAAENQLVLAYLENPRQVCMFLPSGSLFWILPGVPKVVQRGSLLFSLNRATNALVVHQLPNVSMPLHFRLEGFEFADFDVNFPKNLLAATGTFTVSKKCAIAFFNLSTGQYLFNYPTKVVGEVSWGGDEVYFTCQNSLLVLDVSGERVVFSGAFDCAVTDTIRLEDGSYIIEFFGNQLKRVWPATNAVFNFAKTNPTCLHFFCKPLKKLFEFANLENFHILDI